MQPIKGFPGSGGQVTGTASVIKSLTDISSFHAGDILVTVATNPAWTPLIHASAGVVTDIGGSLCHAAIVCREYGKPAVVGTKNATTLIHTGDTIEVSGTTGVVTILPTQL